MSQTLIPGGNAALNSNNIVILEANKTEVGTAIRLLKRKYKPPAE
jgi:hypothetical protein